MPDPREAIYDVLLSKKRRAEEAERQRRRRIGEYQSFAEAWTRYEEQNARANAAARSPRGLRGFTPTLVISDEANELENRGPSEA